MGLAIKTKRASKLLDLVPDGSAVLRQKCRELSSAEILSEEIQKLIDDMYYTVQERKSGVGLSANQVGTLILSKSL